MGGATGRYDLGTMVVVQTVAKGVKVPVIGGGGVVDGRGLVAVLSLGAEAVIMGTRLLVTRECLIHESLKQALLNATELDTMIIMRSVATHRVWINAAATRCAEVEATGADFDEILNIVAGDNSRRVYFEGELDPHPGRGRSQGDRAAPSPDGARRCDRRRHGMAGTADAGVETQRKRRLA